MDSSFPALTDKQLLVLDAIVRLTDEGPLPPTVGEVGAELDGMPSSEVHRFEKILEREGCVRRIPRMIRGLFVTSLGRADLETVEKAA